MQQNLRVFVGLDTSKNKISVALAEDGRRGEVRFLPKRPSSGATRSRLRGFPGERISPL
jgi:transposase